MLDEKAYEKLSSWIISGFPTSTTPDKTNNLSMKLLQRLSSSLLFAEYPSAADAPPDLDVFWRNVEFSFKVLNGSQAGGTVSPTSRRKVKKVVRRSRVDLFQLDSLEVDIPTAEPEVREVHDVDLSELQTILEVREFMIHIAHTWCSTSHSTTSSF